MNTLVRFKSSYPKKFQIHITPRKPVVIGFAFGRSASQRS